MNDDKAVWHEVVCSECHKKCTVPFKPDGRPVFCRECYKKKKTRSVEPSKMRFDGFNHNERGVWKHPRDNTLKCPY